MIFSFKHARIMLANLIKEASNFGWKIVVSADVSAKVCIE